MPLKDRGKTMPKYEILPGLPPYGEGARTFSATGKGQHSEGLVLRFFTSSGSDWIGNFISGAWGCSDVVVHPNGKLLIVVSNGQAYVVDPEKGEVLNLFGRGYLEHIVPVPQTNCVLFGDYSGFIAIGPEGERWTNSRVSTEGIRSLNLEGETLLGEAYDPSHDLWHSFRLDVITGKVSRGVPIGPDGKPHVGLMRRILRRLFGIIASENL